jgi:hypothetical protein
VFAPALIGIAAAPPLSADTGVLVVAWVVTGLVTLACVAVPPITGLKAFNWLFMILPLSGITCQTCSKTLLVGSEPSCELWANRRRQQQYGESGVLTTSYA